MEKSCQFQNAEDAHQAQDPDDHQIMCVCRNQSDIRWQYGQQINDAEEAFRVCPALWSAHQAKNVLDREDAGYDQFSGEEETAVLVSQRMYAVQHYRGNAGENNDNQN